MPPKIVYDAVANAAYISLAPGPAQETREVTEGILFDCDGDGRIVGIEILNARATLPVATLAAAAQASSTFPPET